MDKSNLEMSNIFIEDDGSGVQVGGIGQVVVLYFITNLMRLHCIDEFLLIFR